MKKHSKTGWAIALVAFTLVASIPALAEAPAGLPEAMKSLSGYTFGSSREPLTLVENAVRAANTDAALKATLETQFDDILASGAPIDAKRFICRQLAVMGTAASVPALVKLAESPESNDCALRALQEIPGAEAREALQKAAAAVDNALRLAAVQTLARRAEPESAATLIALSHDTDQAIAQAAITGLGKTASDEAVAALKAGLPGASGALAAAYEDATLSAASFLQKSGNATGAAELLTLLYAPSRSSQIRAAALEGLAKAQPDKALDLMAKGLADNDPHVAKIALGLARRIPGEAATLALCAMLGEASPGGKVALIDALAHRADMAAGPSIREAASSDEEAVQLAAVRALGKVGDASSAVTLLNMSVDVEGSSDLRRVARDSITTLPGDTVNAELLAVAQDKNNELRSDAVRVLGQRRAMDAKDALLKMVESGDPIRNDALKALEVLTSLDDLPRLLDLIAKSESGAEMRGLERVVATTIDREGSEANRAEPLLARLKTSQSPSASAALLRILGSTPTPDAMNALIAALSGKEAEVRAAAIGSLSSWPDAAPIEALRAVLQAPTSPEDRTAALIGYVRLLQVHADQSPDFQIERYAEALKLAQTPEETKQVLGGLSRVADVRALELATAAQSNPDTGAEANQVFIQVAKAISGAAPEEARKRLEQVLASKPGETQTQQAQEALDALDRFDNYLAAWKVSGPYTEPGKTAMMLYNMSFPPEQGAGNWRLMPMCQNPAIPWAIALDQVLGGFERVAYLKTIAVSPDQRDAILETGSNDGIKVWVNGTMLHGLNIGRPFVAGQDKIPVTLNEGANTILLAIYQHGGEWTASARLTKPDGQPMPDIKNELP